MSYKASYWLQNLKPELMNASAFRVLFFLCSYHNEKKDPRDACFPSQETLRDGTGLSNGAVNNALNNLEDACLVARRRSTVPGGTARRTYYMLGCDYDLSATQNPENGDSANSGNMEPVKLLTPFSEGANSTLRASKLHAGGEEPISNIKEEEGKNIKSSFALAAAFWSKRKKAKLAPMIVPGAGKEEGEYLISAGVATRTELASLYWPGITHKPQKERAAK